MISSEHVGELKLRRFKAGELAGDDASEIVSHTQACGSCRAKLRAFEDEQRTFEAAIPFERFAAGVERAVRRPAVRSRPRWVAPALSIAATLLLVLATAPALQSRRLGNRTK